VQSLASQEDFSHASLIQKPVDAVAIFHHLLDGEVVSTLATLLPVTVLIWTVQLQSDRKLTDADGLYGEELEPESTHRGRGRSRMYDQG
jgi:hypothetical protein